MREKITYSVAVAIVPLINSSYLNQSIIIPNELCMRRCIADHNSLESLQSKIHLKSQTLIYVIFYCTILKVNKYIEIEVQSLVTSRCLWPCVPVHKFKLCPSNDLDCLKDKKQSKAGLIFDLLH